MAPKPREVLEPDIDTSQAVRDVAAQYILDEQERKAEATAQEAEAERQQEIINNLPAGVSEEEYLMFKSRLPDGFEPEFDAAGNFVGVTDPQGQFYALSADLQTQQQYFPPPRLAINPISGEREENYTGEGIVNFNTNEFELTDNDGKPRSYMYEDAQYQFYELSDSLRANLLDNLEWLGLPADTALQATDSFWQVMKYANGMGYNWQHALDKLKTQTPDQTNFGSSAKYYVTPRVTVADTANEIARRTIGRKFTKNELDRFVAAYNQAELSYQQQESGVATTQPQIGAAAQQYAENIAPDEATGYKYLQLMDTFAQAVGRFGG